MATASVEIPQVLNHDVAHLDALLRRFMQEIHKSTSSSTSEFNTFDQGRLASYLDRIDAYHAWAKDQPLLDSVETYPTVYPLPQPGDFPLVENEDVNTVVTLLGVARHELLHSQSARVGSGLNVHDSLRLTAIVSKTRKLLLEYIANTQPTDLPESSPSVPISGPGKKGT